MAGFLYNNEVFFQFGSNVGVPPNLCISDIGHVRDLAPYQ